MFKWFKYRCKSGKYDECLEKSEADCLDHYPLEIAGSYTY